MKYLLSLTLFVGVLIFSLPAHAQSYVVQSGDSLWDIANKELGSPWCWTLIASAPENRLDYQGYVFAGTTIELPTKEDCRALFEPVTSSLPLNSQTVDYVFDYPWHPINRIVDDYIDLTYREAIQLNSYSKYDDMSHHNDEFLYREQEGGVWYVVRDGERLVPWDYVDHVLRNDKTGSVFYRARDTNGNWYIVKNEDATLLDFEPKNLYLNPVRDEVIAVRSEEGLTRVFSDVELWSIPMESFPLTVDTQGHLLVLSRENVPVIARTSGGGQQSFCSSSTCSFVNHYWMNGREVATTRNRMVPLYSANEASVPLPFWYDRGEAKRFVYYGQFGRPWFDAEGGLKMMSLFDSRITEHRIDISAIFE